ncbi:unnamed protein product [Thelazia callipaeda]|uniref:CTNNB1_binding domain-containing protein n=1 Tax=Thelazia callipaeda TaxID=103827 RepID=A0A0N5CVY2_THECL|nr:unnamed protein product [Thelazia callipaeda]
MSDSEGTSKESEGKMQESEGNLKDSEESKRDVRHSISSVRRRRHSSEGGYFKGRINEIETPLVPLSFSPGNTPLACSSLYFTSFSPTLIHFKLS